MRKKIPTITRPDPAYASALRPVVVDDPGRAGGEQVEPAPKPESVKADDYPAQPPGRLSAPPPHPGQEDETLQPTMSSSPPAPGRWDFSRSWMSA